MKGTLKAIAASLLTVAVGGVSALIHSAAVREDLLRSIRIAADDGVKGTLQGGKDTLPYVRVPGEWRVEPPRIPISTVSSGVKDPAAAAGISAARKLLAKDHAWLRLTDTDFTDEALAEAWRLPGNEEFRALRTKYSSAADVVQNIDRTVLLKLLRQKEPQSVVRTQKIIGLLPDKNGEGFQGIFGISDPSAAQVSEYAKLYTSTGLEPVEKGFGKEKLYTLLENSPSDQLNVLVGHNAGGEDAVILALPNGDRLALEDLQKQAGKMQKNFVIVCCYARESGIDQSITAAEAMRVAKNLGRRMEEEARSPIRKSVHNGGVPAGLHMTEVMPLLEAEAYSITRNRQKKQAVLIIGVAGAGTTGVMFRMGYPPLPRDRVSYTLSLRDRKPPESNSEPRKPEGSPLP